MVTLRQNAAASGASGRIALTPTIAAALSSESVISVSSRLGSSGSRSHAPVDRLSDRLKVGEQPALGAMNRREVEALLELAELAVGPRHPVDCLGCDGQSRATRVHTAHGGQRARAQAPRRLRVQLLVRGPLRAPGERGRALSLRDQRAKAQQDVLVTGQLLDTAPLEELGKRVVGERSDVRADGGMPGV